MKPCCWLREHERGQSGTIEQLFEITVTVACAPYRSALILVQSIT